MQCTDVAPTTSASDTGVTTGASATTSTATSSSSTAIDSASASLSGPGDDGGEGCACHTRGDTGVRAPWMLAAFLALFRGRGRRRLSGASVYALSLGSLTVASACGPEPVASSATTGTTTTTETTSELATSDTITTDTSSTTSEPQPFRRFGLFHSDKLVVGYENPYDEFLVWMNLEIRADGTLATSVRACTDEPVTRTYTWEDLGDGAIRVVPDEVSPGGTFVWGADQVAAVTLSEGDDCNDITVFIDYTEGSGQMNLTRRYVPGALCAEGAEKPPDAEPWFCGFTFVWCDGVGPEPCE